MKATRTSPTTARIPACPMCSAPSVDVIEQRDHGVATDHHLCAEGHMWSIKWAEDAA